MSRVSRDTVRLVAFSDGVFAITITLLILEIRPPNDDEAGLSALPSRSTASRSA